MNKLDQQMREYQEDNLKKHKFAIGANEHPRPSNVTRLIQTAKAKGIEKISEVMINENEEKNMWLEYWRKRQL
jgi:hypothetical protein